TLLYYAYLNLVKSFLLVEGYDLEKDMEHHGLSMLPDFKKKIKISGEGKNAISIFWEFSKRLGDDVTSNSGYKITLDELLQEMPEVHEIGHALNLYEPNRKLLPVDISIMTNAGTYTKLFYEISFKHYQKELLPVHKLDRNHFKDKIYEVSCYEGECPDQVFYRSSLRPSFTNSSDKSWDRAYHKLTDELDDIGATV